jgi:hypothetical protein
MPLRAFMRLYGRSELVSGREDERWCLRLVSLTMTRIHQVTMFEEWQRE